MKRSSVEIDVVVVPFGDRIARKTIVIIPSTDAVGRGAVEGACPSKCIVECALNTTRVRHQSADSDTAEFFVFCFTHPTAQRLLNNSPHTASDASGRIPDQTIVAKTRQLSTSRKISSELFKRVEDLIVASEICYPARYGEGPEPLQCFVGLTGGSIEEFCRGKTGSRSPLLNFYFSFQAPSKEGYYGEVGTVSRIRFASCSV